MKHDGTESQVLVRMEMSVAASTAAKLARLQKEYGWTRGELIDALVEKSDLPVFSTASFHQVLTLWSSVETLGLECVARDSAAALRIVVALHEIERHLAMLVAANIRNSAK
jgi:hypothetical protein